MMLPVISTTATTTVAILSGAMPVLSKPDPMNSTEAPNRCLYTRKSFMVHPTQYPRDGLTKMEFALRAAVIAACVIAVIAVLSIFFQWLPRLGPRRREPALGKGADTLFASDRYYAIQLVDGTRIGPVRLESFVDRDDYPDLPFGFETLVIFMTPHEKRVIVQLRSVRIAEEIQDAEERQT